MSPDEETAGPDGGAPAAGSAMVFGAVIGDNNVQVNVYGSSTWADRAAQPPLDGGFGAIESPYRGLSAFEEKDEPFFFGREAATSEVVRRMSLCAGGPGLLVMSGVSGSGKSSLLRAGMLPRMRSHGLASVPGSASWPRLLFTPTHAPLDELAVLVAFLAQADAAAIRRDLASDPGGFALAVRQAVVTQQRGAGTGRLLLVVDQFEQLFTRCADEEQRRAFVTALHAAASGPGPAALVVLGVRADFEARCADYPQLADAVQGRYLLTAMTRRQLRLAITEPARLAGSAVDSQLVTVLLDEAGAGPAPGGVAGAGVLPLLSHALDQAWRNRAGGTLALADYERSGGMEAAVAASADRAYGRLTPAQRATARQVFIQLTATGADGADTAARVSQPELSEGKNAADVQAVLGAFTGERLLTLSAASVEISHEVMLTAWPLLRDTWLAETRADRLVRARLRDTASEWAGNGRNQSYLYRGILLASASATASRVSADPGRHPPLTPGEREFLRASERASRRRTRRLQGVTALLVVLVIVLTAAVIAAVRAGDETATERDAAASGDLAAQSEALGNADPVLARLEAAAAWRLDKSSGRARYAMRNAAALPGIADLTGPGGQVNAVAFSPDGKTLATATGYASTGNGVLQLWDVATRRPAGPPLTVPGAGGILSLAFSPDGTTLAAGSAAGGTQLWNIASRRLTATLPAGTGDAVYSLAFSPDGSALAVGTMSDGDPGTLPGGTQLWNARTRQPDSRLLAVPGAAGILSLAFSPDGTTLAAGTSSRGTQLWNVAARRQVGTIPNGHAVSVAFSKHGILASVSSAGAELWNTATRRKIAALPAGNGEDDSVAFSPDGKTLAIGTYDGGTQLWNADTRRRASAPLSGAGNSAESVAFSPDGKTLAAGTSAGTQVWSVPVATGTPAATLPASGGAYSVAFSPDGRTLAICSAENGTVRLWAVATRKPLGAALPGTAGGLAVAFSPNGNVLAIANVNNNTTQLWNLAARNKTTLHGTSEAASVAFSPDGKTLAIATEYGTQLWNVSTRTNIATLPGSDAGSVAFSPDGKILATNGGPDTSLQLWNIAKQRLATPLASGTSVFSVAFSPDGTTLAAATGSGTQLWDVATRQQIGAQLPSSNGTQSVAFSPDGTILAAATGSGTQLWDVATRQQIGAQLPSSNGTQSVAISPDGTILAAGTSDGRTQLWNVAYLLPADTMPYLCATARQSLTRAQWVQYTEGAPYQDICPQRHAALNRHRSTRAKSEPASSRAIAARTSALASSAASSNDRLSAALSGPDVRP